MGDYINREDAIRELDCISFETQYEAAEVEDALRSLPAADVVEVVRCKDCKFAHLTYDGDCKYCDVWFPDEPAYVSGDHYCSFGERRTNG